MTLSAPLARTGSCGDIGGDAGRPVRELPPSIPPADFDRISEIVGPNRTVYLVNLKIPRSYRRTQNERLAARAQRHANTELIDRFDHSRDNPSWFAADGYHLTSTGQTRFASFLATMTS